MDVVEVVFGESLRGLRSLRITIELAIELVTVTAKTIESIHVQ